MHALNDKAGALAFEARNAGRPSDEVDLHGLTVAEAKKKAEEVGWWADSLQTGCECSPVWMGVTMWCIGVHWAESP